MNQLARPVFGVIARTAYGRDHLGPSDLQPWVSGWLAKPEEDIWWIDAPAGIALFQPEAVYRDEEAGEDHVLCIRGSVVADGIDWPAAAFSGAGGLNGLLHCLRVKDAAAIRQMRGQFCFAWWDGNRRMLSLVRDHMGQRCLYVRTDQHYLIFCSELAPLLRSPAAANELDAESAFWYLSFGMPVPGKTLVKNIRRVPAGHLLRWDGEAMHQQRYWSPLAAEAPLEVTDDFLSVARQTLDRAVARCSREGETNGIFLSGGVDSTFLAATARQQGMALHAFTSAFDERYGINETDYAGAVASWLDIPYDVTTITTGDVLSDMEDVLLSAAEPCAAWATLTHFRLLADMQQRGIRHVMSGLGADEIFGGYDHFRGYYSRYCRYVQSQQLPLGIDAFDSILATSSPSASRVLYPGVARLFDDKALREGLEAPYNSWSYADHLRHFYRECRRLKPEADVMEMMVAHECQHRIPDLLFSNFEPLSRRMGIESVYPFLDPDLINLVAGLSVTSRYRTQKGTFSLRLNQLIPRFKYAMMRIAEDRVPQEIRDRPRSSYTAPFGQWLREPEFAGYVLSRIRQSAFWETGIVKKTYLGEIVDRLEAGPGPWVFKLWALFTLSAWYDLHIAGKRR